MYCLAYHLEFIPLATLTIVIILLVGFKLFKSTCSPSSILPAIISFVEVTVFIVIVFIVASVHVNN